MTLYIRYDHKCPKCDAYYIPYDNDVPVRNAVSWKKRDSTTYPKQQDPSLQPR